MQSFTKRDITVDGVRVQVLQAGQRHHPIFNDSSVLSKLACHQAV
jgi:hypothetical protein